MGKSLNTLISQNQEQILEEWIYLRLESFSKQKGALIIAQRNPLQNSIRHQLHECLKVILKNFEKKGEKYTEAVEQICRILAIQDFPPSTAMALFYELKVIMRKLVKKTGVGFKAKDWLEFNSCIEEMTLEAFDCYCFQRERMVNHDLESSSL
jgi:hypothetical protein